MTVFANTCDSAAIFRPWAEQQKTRRKREDGGDVIIFTAGDETYTVYDGYYMLDIIEPIFSLMKDQSVTNRELHERIEKKMWDDFYENWFKEEENFPRPQLIASSEEAQDLPTL